MLERDLQKKCVKYARERGCWASKFVAQGRRSAPDYIFADGGQIFFVEFKAPGQKPTELQVEEHRKMRHQLLKVYVCDSFEQFKSLFNEEPPFG